MKLKSNTINLKLLVLSGKLYRLLKLYYSDNDVELAYQISFSVSTISTRENQNDAISSIIYISTNISIELPCPGVPFIKSINADYISLL